MARASVRAVLLAAGLVLASCSQLGPEHQDTYRQLLARLCGAPPSVMGNVLTTPELQRGWEFICGHVASVPATPVTAEADGPARVVVFTRRP